MARKSSSNAVEVQKRQTRSDSKAGKALKTSQLATPPPEAGASTTDTHRAAKGDNDNKAPAGPVKDTPKKSNKDPGRPTVVALSVNPGLEDLGESETQETQATSTVSDHEEGTDHDPRPDSPMTHVFPRDPLTGGNKITKATLYCPITSHILMYLPALSENQEKRLLIKSALGKEFRDKKSKLDKQLEKDKNRKYIKVPNRVSRSELTEMGINKQDLKLIDAGYQVPKDGIPSSQLSRRKGRVVWKYDKRHPNAWCLVTRNEQGKDGDGKGGIWILSIREWTDWKGGSSRKEIQGIWATSGTPVPIKYDEEIDEDEDQEEENGEEGNENEDKDKDEDKDEVSDDEGANNER